MSSIISYKGTRWFKCDFHLHTTASLCFQDREVTAKQWVDRAIAQGLNCVAVTDHNTGFGIDDIKAAAVGTDLTVFLVLKLLVMLQKFIC
ncbi:MAG: PHP domain-containing protein [Bacteroidetes bacterium]|nr:PHP domain-containing protein [Bacteroidota bacterium]